MKTEAALMTAVIALAGCGAETAERETAVATENTDSIARPMIDAMDDAKALEDQVMQHKAAIDAALDEAQHKDDE